MLRLAWFAFAVAASPLGTASAADASPRDELLRLAPTDSAVLVLVQNARIHFGNIAESPFAQWFPSTAIGKQILESAEYKQFRAASGMIFSELGATPATLVEDVLGEAVAFAFTPAPRNRPNDERGCILIRPRKPEVLARLIDKLNDVQTRTGELKAVVQKERSGVSYRERQKQAGSSEFYCFCNGTFVFSSAESEVVGLIDRDKSNPPALEKAPVLTERMTKLGIAEAAAIVLIEPRSLDAEVQAKVGAAKPEDKRFLSRFAEVWSSLESAAIYLALDRGIELGVSVRFQSGKLPPDAKKWLTGIRMPTTAESLIPNDALFGFAGQIRAVELIEAIASLTPIEPGKPDVKAWIGQVLGPIIGRDKLPQVLESLGPNWAIWAEPPAPGGALPIAAAAVEIRGEPEARAKAEKAILQALEFGFQTARVAYNSKHADQIEIENEKDARTGATISTLSNGKFPPGFNPSFAIVRGYLVVATSPAAIKRFDVPKPENVPVKDYSTLAKFSGTRTRAYLSERQGDLAQFLSSLGVGPEKALREQFEGLAAALELVDSADIIARGDESGLRLSLRIELAKPLKK